MDSGTRRVFENARSWEVTIPTGRRKEHPDIMIVAKIRVGPKVRREVIGGYTECVGAEWREEVGLGGDDEMMR